MPNTLAHAFSPAKLNLFLHIIGKRADGYHNLQTVFVATDFGDELLFLSSQAQTLVTLCGADGLTDELSDNLIVKAASRLADYAKMVGRGDAIFPIQIHLTKKIPIGAGLGGGSSNAATVLTTLNRLWGLNFEMSILMSIAQTLGADVPFFVSGHRCAVGEGIGEVLTAIELPVERYLVLFPSVHTSTQSVFANALLKKDCQPLTYEQILQNSGDFVGKLNAPFCNVFEPIVAKNPPIKTALAYLNDLSVHTSTTPRLTGTGSAVFLPLGATPKSDAERWLADAPCAGVICEQL